MYTDSELFTEVAQIEELLNDQAYELERRCHIVQRGITQNLFTTEAALRCYGVSRQEYEAFLGKEMTRLLQSHISPDFLTLLDYSSLVHVMAKMMQSLETVPHHSKKINLAPTIQAVNRLSQDLAHLDFQLHK